MLNSIVKILRRWLRKNEMSLKRTMDDQVSLVFFFHSGRLWTSWWCKKPFHLSYSILKKITVRQRNHLIIKMKIIFRDHRRIQLRRGWEFHLTTISFPLAVGFVDAGLSCFGKALRIRSGLIPTDKHLARRQNVQMRRVRMSILQVLLNSISRLGL